MDFYFERVEYSAASSDISLLVLLRVVSVLLYIANIDSSAPRRCVENIIVLSVCIK